MAVVDGNAVWILCSGSWLVPLDAEVLKHHIDKAVRRCFKFEDEKFSLLSKTHLQGLAWVLCRVQLIMEKGNNAAAQNPHEHLCTRIEVFILINPHV